MTIWFEIFLFQNRAFFTILSGVFAPTMTGYIVENSVSSFVKSDANTNEKN